MAVDDARHVRAKSHDLQARSTKGKSLRRGGVGQEGPGRRIEGKLTSYPNAIPGIFTGGDSLPLWFTLSPPGYGHAVIFDVRNNRARPLSLLECWLIAGGTESLFKNLPKGYVANSILTSTAPAVQLYLIQLVLGLLGLLPRKTRW